MNEQDLEQLAPRRPASKTETEEMLLKVASELHEWEDGHDPENFRGCTHPTCKKVKQLLRPGGERWRREALWSQFQGAGISRDTFDVMYDAAIGE